MIYTRRQFLGRAAFVGGACLASQYDLHAANNQRDTMIIDTHQHLWDLSKFTLPWLQDAPEVLRRSYRTADYLEATRGLRIQAVYMEVDVDAAQHDAEAEHVVALCRSEEHPTVAAVVGGRPASPGFKDYIRRLKKHPEVKGIRQVLHGATTGAGFCLQKDFVRGIQQLGENGLSFDLCMRPGELPDGATLAELCPETQFIVDHCGNADPQAFAAGAKEPSHDPDAWRRAMEALAKRPNTICKISGIVARAPQGWKPDDLAPIVNHCLDTFGPDRVIFGSDWPVCLLGASLRQWVDALSEIVSERPAEVQNKLWSGNALKRYALKA